MAKRFHVSFRRPGLDEREILHVVSKDTLEEAIAVCTAKGFLDVVGFEEQYGCNQDRGYDSFKKHSDEKKADRGKMLDKIRKLMALASSPNENEAAAAAEKAQALLAEYNIDMAELEAHGGKAVDEKIIMDKSTRTVSRNGAWQRIIRGAVARLYFCGYFYTYTRDYDSTEVAKNAYGYVPYDIHTYTGKPSNVEVTKMMSEYLTNAVERLAKEHGKGQGSSFRNAFRNAAASRLRERLDDRRRETSRSGVKTSDGRNLPALLNTYETEQKAVEKYWGDVGLKLGKSRSLQARDAAGHAAGRKAADSISLDPQIRGGGATKGIGHTKKIGNG